MSRRYGWGGRPPRIGRLKCRHCKKDIEFQKRSQDFNILKYEDKVIGTNSIYIHIQNGSKKCRPDVGRSKIAFPKSADPDKCPECGSVVIKQDNLDIHVCRNAKCSYWWSPMTGEIEEEIGRGMNASIYDQELGQSLGKKGKKAMKGTDTTVDDLLTRRKRKIRVKKGEDDAED